MRVTTETLERQHVKSPRGRALIVGSHVYPNRVDRHSFYREATEVIGVDKIAGAGVDYALDLECPLGILDCDRLGAFDHVECLSVLEHSAKPWLVAQNIERMMRRKATLHLTVPFVWRVHAYPSDFWRMTTDAVRSIFARITWTVLTYATMLRQVEDGEKLPAIEQDGQLYVARTEVFGYGWFA